MFFFILEFDGVEYVIISQWFTRSCGICYVHCLSY